MCLRDESHAKFLAWILRQFRMCADFAVQWLFVLAFFCGAGILPVGFCKLCYCANRRRDASVMKFYLRTHVSRFRVAYRSESLIQLGAVGRPLICGFGVCSAGILPAGFDLRCIFRKPPARRRRYEIPSHECDPSENMFIKVKSAKPRAILRWARAPAIRSRHRARRGAQLQSCHFRAWD